MPKNKFINISSDYKELFINLNDVVMLSQETDYTTYVPSKRYDVVMRNGNIIKVDERTYSKIKEELGL